MGAEHLDIKKRFAESLNISRPCGVGDALRRVGLTFEGSPQRGVDDARNMAGLPGCLLN